MTIPELQQPDPPTMIGSRTLKRRRRRTVFLFAVIAIAVVCLGYHRFPTGAAAGNSFSQPWPSGLLMPRTIRVATYNIDGGVGLDDRYDLSRIADAIRGYDLIGMNEVHGRLFGSPQNQAQELGDALHLPYLYAPSERRWFHDDFGNAVISMIPITRWMRIPLTGTQTRGIRNVVLLETNVAGQKLRVLITHLDREQDRSVQLQSVAMLFESLAEPAILMGDLNRYPDDPELLQFIHTPGIEDCLARFPSKFNAHRVDWILARGMTAIQAGLDDESNASDHPLAWAELRLSPNAPNKLISHK